MSGAAASQSLWANICQLPACAHELSVVVDIVSKHWWLPIPVIVAFASLFRINEVRNRRGLDMRVQGH